MTKKPTDEIAALVFGFVTVLNTSGALARMGVTAELALEIVTWGMTGAALVRAWWLRGKAKESTTTITVTTPAKPDPETNGRAAPTHVDPEATTEPLDGLEHEEILR